jgi:hypothetical protein
MTNTFLIPTGFEQVRSGGLAVQQGENKGRGVRDAVVGERRVRDTASSSTHLG